MKTHQRIYQRIQLTTLAFVLMGLNCFAQWQTTTGPNSAGNISSLAIKSATVFAGTSTGGVFASTDKGVNWTAKNNGISNSGDVKSIAVDGNNMYAGVSAFSTSNTVFGSTDDAANWSLKGIGYFTYLFCIAAKPSYLIAGTWYGVEFSTNNGTSWTGSIAGLPSNASVVDFSFDGTKIFCAVSASGGGGTGVFLSSDNGVNWTDFNTPLTSTIAVNKLAIIGSNIFAGTQSGGVLVSNTTTASWASANTGLSGNLIRSLWVVGNHLFAGTDNGIYKTSNNGTSWTDISAGLPANSKIYSITSDATDMYVGTDTKVWKRPISELIITTGIKETFSENTNVKIYPNPINEMLNVELEILNGGFDPSTSSISNTQIQILNSLGEVILEEPAVNTKNLTLNIQNFAEGLYFLKVISNGKIISSQKIIKQ